MRRVSRSVLTGLNPALTGGGPCTFAGVAVSMKYANEISKEVPWEHFSWRFRNTLNCQRCSRCGFSLSEETVLLVLGCGESVKDEA